MRKKLFTFLFALMASVGMSWATENSIVINGTPAVGDNSISLTYYFDPANVPGITGYAPTLKVKCVTDNIWDEKWLSLYSISSGTQTINLNTLGEFQAGKSYEVCFAYYNGSWVDEMFQSFSFSTPAVIDLATITTDYVIPDGATLTGTLQNNVVLTVADNATITLSNVDINWAATWTGGDHAGITCDNATIILAECTTNKIRGFLDGNPGVRVRPGKTLTIQGTGTLYAATNGGAAAIGGGYGPQNSSVRDGGNIVILNGTIFATGGNLGAGIGSGGRSKVGNITIQGGIITATGGGSAAGIGCGQTKQSDWKAQCGNITITNGVKYLKTTKGSGAEHSIGKGNNSGTAVCGTVTINGTTGAISTSPYTYSPAADNVKNLINAIGTVEYNTESKDKIDAARAAYEALADYSCDVDAVNALKDAVSNYSTLTDAEAAYDALIPTDQNITPYVDPQDASLYYSTFFDSSVKYELPAGVEAYVADLSGANLLLTKIAEAGEVIPANVAVILKSTVTPITLTVSDADAVTFTATNDLHGSDTQIATPANCYVLAGTDGVVGFYHYTAALLNAHKAYVVYSGSNQAPRRMPFIFDQATGVENVQNSDIRSQKVVENGQLIIIRNGVRYNAAGQNVK